MKAKTILNIAGSVIFGIGLSVPIKIVFTDRGVSDPVGVSASCLLLLGGAFLVAASTTDWNDPRT